MKKEKLDIPEDALAHMKVEAENEWGAYLTTRPIQAEKLGRDAFIRRRMKEKTGQYKTDPAFRDAYERWDFHHGYSAPVPKTKFKPRQGKLQGRDPATIGKGEDF